MDVETMADPVTRISGNKARRLRIAIATTTRFHVTDLARELLTQGFDVQFISYVPKSRARDYGVPTERQSSILAIMLPILAWERVLPSLAPNFRSWIRVKLVNWAAKFLLRDCDVFVCMSGVYLEAAHYAKRRYGAQIWLERGSTHILTQEAILARIPNCAVPSDSDVFREIAGYNLADQILIASSHVEESFLEQSPELAKKLIRIPYGVNVDEFPMEVRPKSGPVWRLLMVGNWSLRKGCDVLAEAILGMEDVELMHVGSLGDCPFPVSNPRLMHVNAVPQSLLSTYYAQAHIAVLASREEGLAMVQAQSLASGLPLVGTTMSGARDLGLSKTLAANIFICPDGDALALRQTIRDAISAVEGGQLPCITAVDRNLLSWHRYGQRYGQELRARVLIDPA